MSTTVAMEPTGNVPAFQTLKLPQAKAPDFDFTAGLQEINTPPSAAPVEKKPEVEKKSEPKPEEKPEPKPDPEVKTETKKVETPFGNLEVPEQKAEKKPEPKPEAKVEPEEDEEPMPVLPDSRKKQEEALVAKERDLRAARRELKAKQTELEEARAKTAAQPVNVQEADEYKQLASKHQAAQEEIEKRKQDIESYRKRELIWNVKNSEDYQKSVMEPWNQISLDATDIATTGIISYNDIYAIAALPALEQKSKLREIREGMDAHDYTALVGLLPKIKEVQERALTLEQGAQQHQELLREERDKQQKEAQSRYTKDLTAERKNFRPIFDQKFIPNHSDPEVQKSIQAANSFIDNTNWYDVPADKQAQIMEVAGKASLAIQLMESQHRQEKEDMQKQIDDLQKEKDELEATTKKLSKASPGAGGNSTQRQSTEPLKVDAKDFSTKTAAEWLT